MSKTRHSAISVFKSSEKENITETLKLYKKEMNVYRSSFNLLSKNIDFLFEQTARIPLDFVYIANIMAVYRLLGTMQSIKDLTLKRYYFESNILRRNFYETLGLCIHFRKNPEDAMNWLFGKRVDIASIKLFKMVGELYNADESESKEFYATYGLLSNFTHSNAQAYSAIVTDFVEDSALNDETVNRAMGFRVPTSRCDYNYVLGMVIQPCILLHALLYLFEKSLPEDRKSKIVEFLDRAFYTLARLESSAVADGKIDP